MEDIVVGLFAVGVGLLVCFRGYLAMRVIIPVWGAFAGFVAGAGLVAALAGENFLADLFGWILGVVLAAVFAVFAYLYFEAAVIIGMGAIGFSLGAGIMTALGITWSWLIILVALAVAALVAFVAIAGDMPRVILVVLTALAGASAVTFGVALITGSLDVDNLDEAAATELLNDEWWAYVLYAVLVIVGIVAQLSYTDRLRQTLRSQWNDASGRTLGAS